MEIPITTGGYDSANYKHKLCFSGDATICRYELNTEKEKPDPDKEIGGSDRVDSIVKDCDYEIWEGSNDRTHLIGAEAFFDNGGVSTPQGFCTDFPSDSFANAFRLRVKDDSRQEADETIAATLWGIRKGTDPREHHRGVGGRHVILNDDVVAPEGGGDPKGRTPPTRTPPTATPPPSSGGGGSVAPVSHDQSPVPPYKLEYSELLGPAVDGVPSPAREMGQYKIRVLDEETGKRPPTTTIDGVLRSVRWQLAGSDACGKETLSFCRWLSEQEGALAFLWFGDLVESRELAGHDVANARIAFRVDGAKAIDKGGYSLCVVDVQRSLDYQRRLNDGYVPDIEGSNRWLLNLYGESAEVPTDKRSRLMIGFNRDPGNYNRCEP